jgi:hypothetical protein
MTGRLIPMGMPGVHGTGGCWFPVVGPRGSIPDGVGPAATIVQAALGLAPVEAAADASADEAAAIEPEATEPGATEELRGPEEPESPGGLEHDFSLHPAAISMMTMAARPRRRLPVSDRLSISSLPSATSDHRHSRTGHRTANAMPA